ncbi:uncharacterized protein LOC119168525 isoform X4 [Rhipicephalus microplus]|uniref:uncharacterized protein LOC119168525 isoform X4 n=1 Tax=Rhipicephalus microplus TaxID=6941 RepID=UPI003F6CC9EA
MFDLRNRGFPEQAGRGVTSATSARKEQGRCRTSTTTCAAANTSGRSTSTRKRGLAWEQASRAEPSLRQSKTPTWSYRASKAEKLSSGEKIENSASNPHGRSKEPIKSAVVVKNGDRATKRGKQGHQSSKRASSQDYEDAQPNKHSRRDPSADYRGKASKRASVGRSRSSSSHRRKSADYADNPASKDNPFEADTLSVEEHVDSDSDDDDYEMNRNWNGPPRFPMAPYNRGGPFRGYRGRGTFMWNRPPLPQPYNRYDNSRSPFNAYNQRPPAGGHSQWSDDDYNCNFEPYGNGGWQGGSNRWDREGRKDTWQGSDCASKDDGHRGDSRKDGDDGRRDDSRRDDGRRDDSRRDDSRRDDGRRDDGRRDNSRWDTVRRDDDRRDNGRKSRHQSPESAPGTGSRGERAATRDNKEQGDKVATRNSGSSKSQSSSDKSSVSARSSTAVSTRLRSSTASSISVHISNREPPPLARSPKTMVTATIVTESIKEPVSRRSEGTVKSGSLSGRSQKKDSTVQEPNKVAIKSVKKRSPQAPTVKGTLGKAKPAVNLGLSTKSKAPDVLKTLAGLSKTGATSSPTSSGKLISKPRPTARSSASPSTVVTNTTVQVKKEFVENMGSAAEAIAAAASLLSSSGRNHLIFLSSEDEDADAQGKEASNRQERRGDKMSATEKAGSSENHIKPALSFSPERGDAQAKKTLMSPKLGLLSTKDVYRRDVLDKLVNFPSSPQVQAQLNKWMMEMQKSQRSVMARKSMRPSTTQARLGPDDDTLLGSIPSIDFDVLVKQVESCELPEEMLKSLMHALSTDTEQPHSTAAEVPSPVTTGLGSKGSGSLRATPELRASPRSAPPSSSRTARSPATKASPVLPKISSAAKSPGVKGGSNVSVKSAAKPSVEGASSSDDECLVVPAPKEKVVPVVIDSDEHNTSDEDNRPSTTTSTVKVSQEKATPPPQCASSTPTPAQQSSKQVRKVEKPARRKGRQPSASADSSTADSAAALPTPSPPVAARDEETVAAELSREAKRSSSRSKSATPITSESHAASTSAVLSPGMASSSGVRRHSQASVSPAMFTEASSPAASSPGMASSSFIRRRSQTSVSPATFAVASMPAVSSPKATLSNCVRHGSPASVSAATFPKNSSERPVSGRSPLPSVAPKSSPPLEAVITKVEPPPTPPPPVTPPDDVNPLNFVPLGGTPSGEMPSGSMPSGAMPTDTKPPVQAAMKTLVNDLAHRCQLEDTIRQELAQVEQGIASALATLEELKKRKEELVTREAQVRKERLEILQCLQGAASALPGDSQPLLHFTLPAQSVAAMEMFSSFGTGSSDVMFGVAPAPPPGGASVFAGQGGEPFAQAPAPIARDIAQLLLPHLQQFGADIDINKLSTSTGHSGLSMPTTSSAMPTMSPEVSGGPSSRRAMTKRKMAKDGEPATRKRTRTTKAEAEGEAEESQLDQIPPCQEISAHDSPIVAVKLVGHYVYSCSNDCSARRHNLLDSSQCVIYLGSTKTVNSIEVHNGKNHPAVLYTASLDGLLRSYDPETGDCFNTFNAESPIMCTALAWGKIYLGLQTGYVAVFNVKSRTLQDTFFCSNTSLSRITTSTEGAQKLLCTISFDGGITFRDPSTGLLFRCLEGVVQPPCYISINNGTVYTSSSDRTIRIHELRTGILQKVYECRSAATGLRYHKGLIVCCSFDGLIRCYKTKDFSCEVVYYGAGKNMVMSMDVCGPLIATGNRKGKIEVIKFDKSSLQTCEIRSCNLKFAREEDLLHHLKREHIGLGAKGAMTCPWNHCQMTFSGPNCNKDFEKHLMDHACT